MRDKRKGHGIHIHIQSNWIHIELYVKLEAIHQSGKGHDRKLH